MPNMGAVQPCCLSSACGGGGACMGLKIFCLNLSHCLDLVSVLVCMCVCVRMSECVRARVCACHRRIYERWCLCVWVSTCRYQ